MVRAACAYAARFLVFLFSIGVKAMQAGNEQKLEKMQEAVTRSMAEMKKSQQDDECRLRESRCHGFS
jgi:hypothetical protein